METIKITKEEYRDFLRWREKRNELETLRTEVSKKWQGPHDAVKEIREQRGGNYGDGGAQGADSYQAGAEPRNAYCTERR